MRKCIKCGSINNLTTIETGPGTFDYAYICKSCNENIDKEFYKKVF